MKVIAHFRRPLRLAACDSHCLTSEGVRGRADKSSKLPFVVEGNLRVRLCASHQIKTILQDILCTGVMQYDDDEDDEVENEVMLVVVMMMMEDVLVKKCCSVLIHQRATFIKLLIFRVRSLLLFFSLVFPFLLRLWQRQNQTDNQTILIIIKK